MMFETAEHGAASGVVSKGGIPSQQIIQTCTQAGAFAVTAMIIGSALHQPEECRHVKQVCVTSECVRKTAKHLQSERQTQSRHHRYTSCPYLLSSPT